MNNLQHIVKDNTRFAMHMAVELCEQGDFDSVPEAFRWLNQETVGNYTRWNELFGAPERTALMLTHNTPSTCDECALIDICDIGMPATCMVNDYDALLDWLKQAVGR